MDIAWRMCPSLIIATLKSREREFLQVMFQEFWIFIEISWKMVLVSTIKKCNWEKKNGAFENNIQQSFFLVTNWQRSFAIVSNVFKHNLIYFVKLSFISHLWPKLRVNFENCHIYNRKFLHVFVILSSPCEIFPTNGFIFMKSTFSVPLLVKFVHSWYRWALMTILQPTGSLCSIIL